MPNENCLEGMRCPKCESLGPFRIAVSTWATIYDDGVEETEDYEWGDGNTCVCKECGFIDFVSEFRKE